MPEYRLVIRVPEGREPHTLMPVSSWAALLKQVAGHRKLQSEGYVRKDAIATVERREHGPAPWQEAASV